jgi:type II secretory pathway pseudopilin PulG
MKGGSGWTVVEMLAAMTCSLLILAALGGFVRGQTRFLDRETRRLALRESCRRVLDMVAREVRAAGYEPVSGTFDGAADGLAIAARDRIELRSDLHGSSAADQPDGILDVDSDERIGFFLNPARGQVSEAVGRQTLPLTLDFSVPEGGFELRYLDACGAEIAATSGSSLTAVERARVRSVAARLNVTQPGVGGVSADIVSTLRNREVLRCEATE